MSTSMRRTRDQALIHALDFRRLLSPDVTCERFEFAGSLRRQKPDVGDCDVVAIPKFGEIPSGDMFGTPVRVNLLWHRVDEHLAAGTFTKHVKETTAGPRTKWGNTSRAIEFRGCAYEIELADADNWALKMIVRTGPAELSMEVVTRLKKYGYPSREGFYIWDVKAEPPKRLVAPTEDQIFKICGLQYRAPEARG